MAEYIDRLKIIERIKEKERHGLSFKASDLDGIPFYTDVQPVVHSKWIPVAGTNQLYLCMNCRYASWGRGKYCSDCGARMVNNGNNN